jgi:predicted lysophospholipase L1 biosynthesis ABC-type transport system permease subunit
MKMSWPEIVSWLAGATTALVIPLRRATGISSLSAWNASATPRRFFALLVGVFAGLGLLLASLGIFGVISYSVTRQTQEIGIKMALGASRSRVQLDVISKTLRLALIGIGIGVVASIAVARLIASLLFQTAPTDPLTFAGMVVLLGGVALFAGYLPARRASKIDPMVALRTNWESTTWLPAGFGLSAVSVEPLSGTSLYASSPPKRSRCQ